MVDQAKSYEEFSTPPTRINSAIPFSAPVLTASDDASSIARKLSEAMGSPMADEVIQIDDAWRGLAQRLGEVEADRNLSDEGRKARAEVILEEAEGRFEEAVGSAGAYEASADRLESSVQDFTGDYTPAERDYTMNRLAEECRTPEGKKAVAARFMAACNKPFSELRKAEGLTLRAVLDSADLGVPLIEPLVLNAAWETLKAKAPQNPHALAMRERAAAIRSATSTARQDLDRAARRLGLRGPVTVR